MTAPNEVDQDPAARAAQLDPDAQLDLLDRELARRRAERAAEADRAKAQAARAPAAAPSSPGSGPGWAAGLAGNTHGAVCHPCDRERGGPSGDDREHRIRAARQVLGDTPAPSWAGHGSEPAARYWHDDYLADAFRWWYETPGARPGRGSERFGYLSGPELVARLYEGRGPRPPQLHSRGRRHRCAGCGAKGEVWTVEQVAVAAAVGSDGELSRVARSHFRVTWTCWRCRHEDVEQRAEQLPGVPVSGLVG
jgi:hypothetical protein